MNNREKILAAAVAILFAYMGLQWIVTKRIIEPLRAKDVELANLELSMKTKEAEVTKAKQAEADVENWKSRALPQKTDLARTLYQDYLRTLCADAGISNTTTTSTRPNARGTYFTRLPFTLRAPGCDLMQLTKLLYAFYSSDILHQIRRISLKPVIERGRLREFDVTLSIEAISMSDALAKDDLPKLKAPPKGTPAPPPKRPITDFELFAKKNPFQPSRFIKSDEIVRSTEPDHDERADYYVFGTVVEDGVGKVLLKNSKAGKILKVPVGEEVKIGGLQAKVVEVLPGQRVVLQVGSQLGSVVPGRSLASWSALPQLSQARQ